MIRWTNDREFSIFILPCTHTLKGRSAETKTLHKRFTLSCLLIGKQIIIIRVDDNKKWQHVPHAECSELNDWLTGWVGKIRASVAFKVSLFARTFPVSESTFHFFFIIAGAFLVLSLNCCCIQFKIMITYMYIRTTHFLYCRTSK